MKRFWKKYRVLIIALAVVALMVAAGLMRNAADPHAGHDHDANPHTEQNQNADPHAGHDHSNHKAENSYSITTDKNGHYTVTVKDAHGAVIFSRGNLVDKPVCTKVNDQVLIVSNTSGADYGGHWAIFCNVQTNKVSSLFNGCLGTKGTYVACASNTDGTWKVQVQDAFNSQMYSRTHTLEGAASPDGREVISKAELNQNGDLSVTYWAGQQEKTVVIPLP